MGIRFSRALPYEPIPYSHIQRGSPESTQLYQHLRDDGFVIVSLKDHFKEIEDMYEVGQSFLQGDKESKEVHLDPKDENLGYLDIAGVREYIKLRITGDRIGKWPAKPSDFKEKYEKTSQALHDVAWKVFIEALHLSQLEPGRPSKPFEDDVLQSVKECCTQQSSISVIHYYLSQNQETSTTPTPDDKSSYGLRDVCDAHRDTGILTIIMCSQVAGLQVWDRKNNDWLQIEKLLIDNFKKPDEHLAVCIMGEKISLFADSLTATLHRVMVQPTVERYSLLYFMDTAK